MKRITEIHIEKASHNYLTYSLLAAHGEDYRDWQVVLLYYAALQWVDAVIAEKGLGLVTDHYSRERIFDDSDLFSGLRSKYYDLKGISRTARYRPQAGINNKDVSDCLSRYNDIRRRIENVLYPAIADDEEPVGEPQEDT